MTPPAQGQPGSGADIADWRPEDDTFWETTGKRIAYRNLWISIPALLCGFAVWGMWGIITVQMLNLGFPFTQAELFTLTAIAGICRRDHAHPGVVPHPPGRRAQHDLPHHVDAAGAGHRHRHRAAAPRVAAVGLPADGAVVGRGRRQLRQSSMSNISTASSPSACRAPRWASTPAWATSASRPCRS
jgi:hypothetical protein